MKIVVDVEGGDFSPQEVVYGSIEALNLKYDLSICLVGREDGIKQVLSTAKYDENRLEILNAEEVITCEDTPTEAVRKKKNSSLVVGFDKLKNDEETKAFVSTGSTGAVLTGAVLKIGRIKGVSRPALAPLLPTVLGGETMLIDCGANVDCKPINLVHFAIMGKIYMQEVCGVQNPRVAILSNGTEDKKGCNLSKETFELLSKVKNINFVGNMEARDILSGSYDVVVADGFYGNIALKSLEGAVNSVMSVLKEEVMASFKAKIGALFMKDALRKLKNRLDYNKKGGAVFLGIDKVVIKAHGSSKREAVKNAIMQAYKSASYNINDKISLEVNNEELKELLTEKDN